MMFFTGEVDQKWVLNGMPSLTRVCSNDDRVIRLRVAAVAYKGRELGSTRSRISYLVAMSPSRSTWTLYSTTSWTASFRTTRKTRIWSLP